jgi:hypothetical protein
VSRAQQNATKRIVILNELPGDVKDLTEEAAKNIDIDLSGARFGLWMLKERLAGRQSIAMCCIVIR